MHPSLFTNLLNRLIEYLEKFPNHKLTIAEVGDMLIISKPMSLGSLMPFFEKVAEISWIDKEFYVVYFPTTSQAEKEAIVAYLSKFNPNPEIKL